MKKKGKSPRRQLAEKAFKDPKSPGFMSKVKSAKLAGYSDSMAEHHSSEIVRSMDFTDADYANFKVFTSLVPQIDVLMRQKMQKMRESGDISAKDFSNLINLFEKIAKLAGLMKQQIEKKEIKVSVHYPISKCPQCGYQMDIMEE